jgi:hypothetical protein
MIHKSWKEPKIIRNPKVPCTLLENNPEQGFTKLFRFGISRIIHMPITFICVVLCAGFTGLPCSLVGKYSEL